MSLDKSITHGKEHRKPYRGAKAIDRACRNHGGCEWCKGNRTYRYDKKNAVAKRKIEEYISRETEGEC